MLDHYTCTKCGAHPTAEKEVFFGCASCGNKLFKIHDPESTSHPDRSLSHSIPSPAISHPRDPFTSIEVDGAGVFRVNVEKLLESTTKNKKAPLMVSDQEGVYHIKL